MDPYFKKVLIEKYIQIYYTQFNNIVQDAAPKIAKMKNSQLQNLANLVKNPIFETVEAFENKLEENTGRLWQDEYPDLYPVLIRGFSRLKNLADKINKEINHAAAEKPNQIGINVDEIQMELIRRYISSAVKLHLGS